MTIYRTGSWKSSETNQDALVIVDMQPEFSESASIVKPVVKAVEEAKRLGQPIFVLEFGGFGDTSSQIAQKIWEYH